jgi:hypothetical protein
MKLVSAISAPIQRPDRDIDCDIDWSYSTLLTLIKDYILVRGWELCWFGVPLPMNVNFSLGQWQRAKGVFGDYERLGDAWTPFVRRIIAKESWIDRYNGLSQKV